MNKKRIVAVIPARMAASRFPGKPLVKILDLPMIEHVRRRVALCELLDDVIVATCDDAIVKTVKSFGGRAVMTADTHERCTDRVEEAAQNLSADIVVIVQGDEPLFEPQVINQLVAPMLADSAIRCTNLLSTIKDEEDVPDINVVKAVINARQDVLYFSRSPIPYVRTKIRPVFYRQTGLAAFSKEFIHQFSKLTPTPLEISESIDLLRILEHGFSIRGVIYDQKTIGVDNPGDVAKIEAALAKDGRQKKLYESILRA